MGLSGKCRKESAAPPLSALTHSLCCGVIEIVKFGLGCVVSYVMRRLLLQCTCDVRENDLEFEHVLCTGIDRYTAAAVIAEGQWPH